MENSCGFVIIWNNKILLSHPKRSPKNMWGVAKGKIEEGESYLDCARRETLEEIGLDIPLTLITEEIWKTIVYKNIKNKSYKKVHYLVIRIEKLSDIGMSSEIIDKEKLSELEIDEARFMTYEEAKDIIFWRQNEILNFLNINQEV